MCRIKSRLLLALALAAQLCVPGWADEVLQRVPENALGLIVVRDLDLCSGKVERMLTPFDTTYPAPLAFAKVVTGLDQGIDSHGDLVVALLPGHGAQGATEPLVLLPINDYQAFAKSINADASGEICRVTLMGEDILVARDGNFAMLMNVEHQTTMEELVALEAEPIPALETFSAWLPKQDVTLVLMPSGVNALYRWQRTATRLRLRAGYDFTDQPTLFSQLMHTVSGPQTWAWLSRHAEVFALGVRVDSQSNVRLSKQLILKTNSPLSRIGPSTVQEPNAMLGLSKAPYVITGGGTIAEGWGAHLARALREAEQSQAARNGLQHLSPEQWDKEEQAFGHLFADMRSFSFVMLPGEKGEPLLGNFLGIATVPNVEKYFEALPEVVKTWNELTQLSTSDIKPEFTLNTETIGDNRSCEMVIDIAAAARDANTPAFNWMLESALGPEGKLRIRFLQVDATTLLFGIATPEQMKTLLTMVEQSQVTVLHSPESQATRKLLDSTSPWNLLIRPQGCLSWASRVMNEFMGPISDTEWTPPAMPDSPPIGVTFHWQNRRMESDVVFPSRTWDVLGEYISRSSAP